tara:strand:- start:3973 stop:4170 length:198 start_codon:yes stop_codon:yes gene_type:complete
MNDKHDELLNLMDALVNFDAFSSREAQLHFCALIQGWYVNNESELHEFRSKKYNGNKDIMERVFK